MFSGYMMYRADGKIKRPFLPSGMMRRSERRDYHHYIKKAPSPANAYRSRSRHP
jgi:hypothetical protein